MFPKLTGKTIFTDEFHGNFSKLVSLYILVIGIYFHLFSLGNSSKGINSREFNNPRAKYILAVFVSLAQCLQATGVPTCVKSNPDQKMVVLRNRKYIHVWSLLVIRK